MSISKKTYRGSALVKKYSSFRVPVDRVGSVGGVQRAGVEQEPVRGVVVVGVELETPLAGRAAQLVPEVGRGVPVRPVRAAGRVRAGADMPHPQRLGDVELLLEGRRVDLGVRAVGDQPVVVKDLPDLGGRDLPAQDGGVLVVASELDLLVADLGEPGEYPLEAVGHPGVVGRRADPVADAEQDDAPVPGGYERLGAQLTAADRRGSGLEDREVERRPAPRRRRPTRRAGGGG
nr:hypothetical protein GCM10020092_075730 [Actinoplanes digitatis]